MWSVALLEAAKQLEISGLITKKSIEKGVGYFSSNNKMFINKGDIEFAFNVAVEYIREDGTIKFKNMESRVAYKPMPNASNPRARAPPATVRQEQQDEPSEKKVKENRDIEELFGIISSSSEDEECNNSFKQSLEDIAKEFEKSILKPATFAPAAPAASTSLCTPASKQTNTKYKNDMRALQRSCSSLTTQMGKLIQKSEDLVKKIQEVEDNYYSEVVQKPNNPRKRKSVSFNVTD